MNLNEQIRQKWAPVISHPDLPEIADPHKKMVTAMVLENTERALREAASQGVNQQLLSETPSNTIGDNFGGEFAGFDPILISLVRRTLPNLMAYDVCGVQPMSGPTGLIFALSAQYAPDGANTTPRTEAMYDEADTGFSGEHTGGATPTTHTGNSQ